MNLFLIIFSALAALYFIIYFVFAYKTGALRKAVSLSVFSGLLFHAVVGIIAPFTGVWIEYNIWTLGISAATGISGVIGLVLSKLIFI